MEDSFIITIDCSSILTDNQERTYSMLIDTSKMRIIYELVEWIHWMFSLEKCFYLTYENSVVHELEDIKILAKLKKIGIKPCGLSHCVHKKPYRAVLNKLDSYVQWSGEKVPKIFLEKISCLSKGSSRCELGTASEKPSTNTPFTSTFGGSGHKNFDKNEKNKTEDLINLNVISSDSNNESSENMQHALNYYKKYYNIQNSPTSINKLDKPEDLTFKSLNIKNSSKKVLSSPQASGNSEQEQTTNEKEPAKNKSYKNFNKPFSVAAVLSQLRNESQNQTSQEQSVETTSPELNNSFSFEKKISNCEDEEVLACDSNIGQIRKRKRTRRSGRGKKQKSTDLDNDNTSYVPYGSIKTSFNGKNSSFDHKRNHIRFDVSDGEEENNVKVEDPSNCVLQNCDTSSEILKTDLSNNTNKDVEELLTILNEKKKALSNYEGPGISDKQIKFSPVLKNEAEEMIDINNKGNNHLTVTPDSELKNLMQLKEKFGSPVVIERFY